MTKIITYPHPGLRLTAKPILKFDSQVKALAVALLTTVVPDPREPLGVGLAAPQINVSLRMFVMLFPNKKMAVVVNPQIIKVSQLRLADLPENKQFLEGCLSVPGYYAFVDRPQKITVKYQTPSGSIKRKTLNYPFSTYFQHENDHLNGILFIDYLKKTKQQMYFGARRGQLKPVKNPFLV
ncbi:MAG: peptide deformylase [Candidatus Beckwithbacteria bacterium]